jgi:hypothetical protein
MFPFVIDFNQILRNDTCQNAENTAPLPFARFSRVDWIGVWEYTVNIYNGYLSAKEEDVRDQDRIANGI